MELDIEVNKLKMLKAQYLNDKYRLQGNVNKILPEKIKDFKSKIQLIEKDKLNLIKNKGVYLTEEEFNHYLELYKQIQSEWKKLS